jgi:hypothetical protein
MDEEYTTIRGRKLEPFTIHTMLITTLPGSEVHERAAVKSILVTDKGELVYITEPYPNLVKK